MENNNNNFDMDILDDIEAACNAYCEFDKWRLKGDSDEYAQKCMMSMMIAIGRTLVDIRDELRRRNGVAKWVVHPWGVECSHCGGRSVAADRDDAPETFCPWCDYRMSNRTSNGGE